MAEVLFYILCASLGFVIGWFITGPIVWLLATRKNDV